MSEVPDRKKGRRLVLGLFFSAVALVAVWKLGFFEDKPYDFREESEHILQALTGGAESSTAAYEDASFAFQETWILASFVDRADRMTQTLGSFQRILSVEEIERLNTVRGKTARIEYQLEFEKTDTTGELSYLLGKDDKWQLLGFSIRVPQPLWGKLEQVDSEFERIRAPAEVVALVDQTLTAIAEGHGAEVRAVASRPFQESTSEAVFAAQLARMQRELGPFQRRLKILSSGQNAAKERATVSALLQYEKAKTTGRLEFIQVDGQWRLLKLKVLIPEPVFDLRQEL